MIWPDAVNEARKFQYSTVEGFFSQDEPSTDPSTFDYTAVNFGLTYDFYDLNSRKTQWEKFDHHVSRLNRQSTPTVQYKLLYLGRHGEGLHNVAETFYGTAAWNDYWSKLDGDGTVTWADAHLTEQGEQQARQANIFWASRIATQNIPLPERYYTSPLDRCLATASITFSGLSFPESQPFVPEVKELIRETNGVHTCDRRSGKSYIKQHYPSYSVEPGFTENDELWSPEVRESDSAQDVRLKELLDDIFAHDKSTYVSLTAHSGTIASILRVVGHREFRLRTGGVIPVLVKAEQLQRS